MSVTSKVALLKRFIISRTSAYAIQTKDGRYRKVEKELTDAAIIRHLEHKITIGLYNSDENGRCKFCLWDIDNHEGKEIISPHIVRGKVAHLLTLLKSFDVPYLLAESSPGSYHVYTFFSPSATTAEAYDFGRWVMRNSDMGDGECFPKQSIVPTGEYGNLIRAPWSLHRKKNQLYHFISDDFRPIDEISPKTIDISGFVTPSRCMKPGTEALTEDESIDDVFNRIFDTPKRIGNPVPGGIPPCLSSALENGAQLIGGGGHYMRIAITCAYRDAGLPFAALCRLFTGQDDYDQVETGKQVNSVLKKEGGYSYSCRTLREKCFRFVDCKNCPRGKRFK